jgi:localization factor PodJL
MKSVPQNPTSGDVDVREAARAAARREGMSLGQWLDDAIAERAAKLRISPEDLDESDQVDAIAARLSSLATDDAPNEFPPRPAPRPLARRIEIAPPLRSRKPDIRLLDAAAARLNTPRTPPHAGDDVIEVARRIAELEAALGRRPSRRPPDLAPQMESRLRRIAESLLLPDEPQSPELRRIEARLDRLMESIEHAPKAHKPRPDPLLGQIETLRGQIGDLSRAVVVIGERATKQNVEPALLDLLSRIETSRANGVSEDALAPIMEVLLELRASLEHAPATMARAMRDEINALDRRLAAHAETHDGDALRAMRDQVESLARNLADLATRLGGQEALHRQIAALAQRVEEIADAPRQMSEHLVDVMEGLRASIERIDQNPAFLTLQRQIEDMAWQCGEAPATIMDALQDVRASVDALAERSTMAALQAHMAELAKATGEVPRRVLERIDELRRAIENMAAHPVMSADLRAAPLPSLVTESLAEIRLSLERLASSAGIRLADEQAQRLQAIEERVVEISGKLDAPPIIDRIAGLQEAVLARIDRLRSELPHDQISRLRTRVEDVHVAVSQAAAPQPPSQNLDEIVNQLAVRLERSVNTGGQDPRALQAIENQVLRIAERLDRHGEASEAISTLERSIGDLSAQIGEARQSASAEVGETIARDLSSLRSVQDETDRRTRATLEAVHETLEKVVDRLAMLEGDVGALRVRPAPAAAAATVTIAPIAANAAPAVIAPAPTSRHDVALQLSEPRAAQKSFIAAARRATELMGGAPHPQRGENDGRNADASPGEQAAGVSAPAEKTIFGDASRKVMVGVAGLVLSMGAYQMMRDETPMLGADIQQATPKVAEAPVEPPPAPIAESPAPQAQPQIQAQAPAPETLDTMPVASIKRPTTEISRLREMADAGNAPAQLELASRLLEGRGVTRDTALGVRWLEKSAQSYAPAQYRLGALYEKGLGVDRSLKDAAQWYGRAATAGHVRAMHNLGVLLADGVDGRPDYAAAAASFRRAAEHGLRDSQYNLAVLLMRGVGVEANPVEAYKFFDLAGAQGDSDALARRDEVASRMLPKQLGDARKAVESFAARAIDKTANEPLAIDALVGDRVSAAAAQDVAPEGRKADARVTSLK